MAQQRLDNTQPHQSVNAAMGTPPRSDTIDDLFRTDPPPQLPVSKKKSLYDNIMPFPSPFLFGTSGWFCDFWSTQYRDAAGQGDAYTQLVNAAIGQTGHVAHPQWVSFGQGLFYGKSRLFSYIRRGSITGLVHIGYVGKDLTDIYASMRVMFIGQLSLLKLAVVAVLLALLAALPAIAFFPVLWGTNGTGFMKTNYVYDQYSNQYYANGQSIDIDGGVNAYIETVLVITGILSGGFLLFSFWRYNDIFALIREDLDELHRDDISALGQELYVAITNAADTLDFKRLTEEPLSPPSFGADIQTNRTKKRRI